ncbi:YafY family transcriptional regulator [Ruminococcaceae bacterium OttesenSCG-928-D13]|nr:YafY family transcriptional regulator [Ruminococcaceae bacterium OttesenSCG-928-D13]
MKTDRLLKIIYTCLQRERVTIDELAGRLEVSRRTVFRDLETLSAAGIPIVTWPGAGGGVGILEDFKLDRRLLTDDDFSKLATALAGIHSIDGNKDVELLMDKLIPREKRAAPGGDIIIDLSSWFEGDEIDDMFADVRLAIAQRRIISLGYSARGVYTRREVEPYKLVFKYQSWYLYAWCRMREDFRMFKLSRVPRYELTAETFAPRELGSLVFQLQGQRGPEEQEAPARPAEPVEVRLAYRPEDREFLMDRLGAQNFDEGETGGTVRFATTNLPWLTDLVMGLQDKVRVLAPPELRDEVKRRIARMAAVYGEDEKKGEG